MNEEPSHNHDNETLITQPQRSFSWAKLGLLLSICSLLILVSTVVGSFYYIQHKASNFNRTLSFLNQAWVEEKSRVAMLTEKVRDISQRQMQFAENLESTQKEQAILWRMKEAYYLIKLANEQTIYSGQDLPHLLQILESAAALLQGNTDPQVMNIHDAILKEMQEIQRLNVVDMTNLYKKLITVDQQISQLPFVNTPLKNPDATVQLAHKELPWWRVGLNQTWESLKKVVIIQKQMEFSPMTMPSEKQFLMLSLHAQMENVLWAVLHQQPSVYQDSLSRLIQSIALYFDKTSPITQQVLKTLREAQQVNVASLPIKLNQLLLSFEPFLTKDTHASLGTHG